MTIKTWPETALTICQHHAGVTQNPDARLVDEAWAMKYLDELVGMALLSVAEADEIRIACGWGVQLRLLPHMHMCKLLTGAGDDAGIVLL